MRSLPPLTLAASAGTSTPPISRSFHMSSRDLVLAALFAAIIVALGLLPPIMLGFIPVPITAQSMGVMLAGVILGARRGTIAVLLVLLLAAIGLPVLSGGRGGLAVFAAPTTGFLIGWVF